MYQHDSVSICLTSALLSFQDRSRTFNGKIKLLSKAVVSPLDAKDVSAIVRFCSKHQLSPSVRAGGYGIAGWAVAGDVIIDMSLMKDIDIEAPIPANDGVTWTRLKDMPEPGSKGKGRAPAPVELSRTSIKRPREDDNASETSPPPRPLRGFGYNPWTSFDSASSATGTFLRGPALPTEEGEIPREPPRNRPRLHSPDPDRARLHAPPLEKRVSSSGSDVSAQTVDSRSSFTRSTGTAETTPPPSEKEEGAAPTAPITDRRAGNADPFGYISGASPSRLPMYGAVDLAAPSFVSSSVQGPSWSSGGVSSSPFGFPSNMLMSRPLGPLSAPPNLLGMANPSAAPAQPIHNHAYVTFGAGVKQKEWDIYTAENPHVPS